MQYAITAGKGSCNRRKNCWLHIYFSIKFAMYCKTLVQYFKRPFSAAPPRRKDANRQCGVF